MPQLAAEHRFDRQHTIDALRLYALGIFKAIAVGKTLSVLVQQVFPNYHDYGGWMLIVAVLAYTFYLYFDFAGHSEAARAAALMMGIRLPENFKTPFFATNFSGFWKPVAHHFLLLAAGLPVHAAGLGGPVPADPRPPGPAAGVAVSFVRPFWCPASGTATPGPLCCGACSRRPTASARRCCTSAWASPKKKAPARVLWGKRAVL